MSKVPEVHERFMRELAALVAGYAGKIGADEITVLAATYFRSFMECAIQAQDKEIAARTREN